MRTAPAIRDLVDDIITQRRTPQATYRLQLHAGFAFEQARQLVTYLHELGISDVYVSPILQARPSSPHGYDICDHGRINAELGGEDGFNSFATQLQKQGLGLILDMVANHMGVNHHSNRWWMDVLENGPSSIYASYFDIDWRPVNPSLQDKVLLPILGDQYGAELESGRIRLAYEDGAFCLYCYETKLPVAPQTYKQILEFQLDALAKNLGDDNVHLLELRSIVTALGYLPPRTTELTPDKIEERNREKEIIKKRLAALVNASPEVRSTIDATVTVFNGKPGEPHSFDLLDGLIEAQAFRPAYWRVATEEINYRRFFDINDLAAIRVERPEVFQATHQVLLKLLAEGKATGLRIDHPDGLWNPTEYFRRLQRNYCMLRVRGALDVERQADGIEQEVVARLNSRAGAWPLYVVAEKILWEKEPLPRDWAVDGTTGYDFLNAANGLFINSDHRDRFDEIFSAFIGSRLEFAPLVKACQQTILRVSMVSELNALSHQLDRISERNRRYRDFTLNSLAFAIREIIASLLIYRTYITGPDNVPARDRGFLEEAVEDAKTRNPRTAEAIFDFVRDTLLFRTLEDFRDEDRPRIIEWVMKFQQLTGPVLAKGLEDTAYYVFNRLVSLNEVGGHPNQFGLCVDAFHRQNQQRLAHWPNAMLATSTHDTKRGEDVRARINVLSEIPAEWQQALERWRKLNADKKALADGKPAPDANDEYLLYQILVGAWPIQPLDGAGMHAFRKRIVQYMHKATREAKIHTSWINPNVEYDEAVRDFVTRLLPDPVGARQSADGAGVSALAASLPAGDGTPAANKAVTAVATGDGPGVRGKAVASLPAERSGSYTGADPFLKDLSELQRRVAYFGYFNSLSQTLLKLTCPGVPDIYQGTELWDLSLVDPDNRRPVDFESRRTLLRGLRQRMKESGGNLVPFCKELLHNMGDGRIKMYLIHRALVQRRSQPTLYREGTYEPLQVVGAKARHVCAFRRVYEDHEIIVVTPRLVCGLAGGGERPPMGKDVWQDTAVVVSGSEHLRYRNYFTGESLTSVAREGAAPLFLSDVLAHFPVALLQRH
ncbi:MAG: malto-oligosyltrehalose synthase [Gemmataceae bacterium]|nr:malto-oligosyltrehalose synthase [Gemmataceae bacterium]